MQIIFQSKESNQDCWEIFIDGEKWREVHCTIFGRKPISLSVSSWEEWLKIFEALEHKKTKNYMLWRLSSQSYHSEQLAKSLKMRLVQKKTIEQLIQEFQNLGYLDDEMWVKNFMRTHQSRYSLRLILQKLQAKGLCSDTLKELASQWKNPDEELQAIQKLLQTRYRLKDLSQFKEKQKVMASLMRKGFEFGQIQAALSSFSVNDD